MGITDEVEVLRQRCVELVAAVHLSPPEPSVEHEKTFGFAEKSGECVAFEVRRVLVSSEVLKDGGHFIIRFASVVVTLKF